MTTGPEELSLNYLLDPAFQLVNTAGRPLTNGWIEVYYHGTRDKYYCASDFDGTLHPFKIPLDSLGSNIVLADPNFSYDIYVYNSFGSLQMSRYNVNPGSGSGGGSSGEGGPAEHWSSDTAGGASTTVTGGTTVYLTLPSSEDQPEFVDHTTDTAIFLKEGLYHIDAVVSFKQDEDDLQNIIKDLVVNTGLIGWDAQMTGQKNWTGPESTDDDRHFLELHTVVSVPEDSLQTLYFQISSPVDLDSAAIEKLDIIKLEAGGNGIKYTGGYGIDITGQVISTSGMMPEASAANFVYNSTYQVDIQNIYDTIAETSAMIPSGVATEQYVQDFTSAFITEDALNGYATQDWVVDQGYITSADLPQSVPLVAGEGISIVDTSASTIISVDSAYSPGVSEEWVEDYVSNATSGFITSADIPDVPEDLVTSAELATVSGDIVSQIPDVSDMATKTWVGEQGYLTSIPDDLVTSGELATVSGDIMSQIPSQTTVSIDPTIQTGTKIADFNINGTSGELYAPNGGSSYTAGDHIDITNDVISVTGVSGLFAGENVTITTSGGNYYINSIGGGSGSDVFYATFGTTTFDEIWDALDAGKTVFLYEKPWGYSESFMLPLTKAFRSNDAYSSYAYFAQPADPDPYTNYLTAYKAYKVNGNNSWVLDWVYPFRNPSSSDVNKVLTCVGAGQVEWSAPASGSTYTAGDNISIVNDTISVSGTTGLVAGSNISITASGDYYVISSNGGDVPADVVTSGELATVSGEIMSQMPSQTTVSIDPSLSSGTKIAEFNINGTSGELYAPAGGGSVTLPLEVSGSTNVYEARDGLTSGYVNAGEIYVGYHTDNIYEPDTDTVSITPYKVQITGDWGGIYPHVTNVTPDGLEILDDGGGSHYVDGTSIDYWNDAAFALNSSAANWNSAYNAVNSSASNWNEAAGMNEYPISAGPGMSIEDVSGVTVFGPDVPYLTQAVRADETVIYNGNLPNLNETLNLTESWNNFKEIRVVGGKSTDNPQSHYYQTANLGPNRVAFYIDWAYNWMNQGYVKFQSTSDPKIWTYTANTFMWFTHTDTTMGIRQNDTASLNSGCNFKIVGIGRISGGN